MEQTNEKSLFDRLGGTTGISTLVDEIVEAHMENPNISARFLPYKDTPEKLEIIKQHTKDFLASGSGGKVEYKGRDMETTHRGMNINEAEYMHTIDDILMVLVNNNIDEQSRNDVLAILYSLKGMIIGK